LNKYIRLYEDYTAMEDAVSPLNHTWSDFRDTINLKMPFMIIDFDDQDSADQCISSEIHGEDYSEQKYNLKSSAENLDRFPSVFIFQDSSEDDDRINSLLKRFKIKRIICGKQGEPMSKLYVKDGSHDFASDIKTGISPGDMDGDDYYSVGSMYYKFLN
jgi:hypothetical protein